MKLRSGRETMEGLGGTQANSLVDSNTERDDIMSREFVPFTFIGEVQANVVFGKIVLEYDVFIEAAIFNAYFGPPKGQDLIGKVKVNGVTAGSDFLLSDGALYEKSPSATPDAIEVTAGQSIEVFFSQIGLPTGDNTQPGFGVEMKLQLFKKVE